MVRRSCATAAHPEGAVRAGRCGPSDGAYVVERCVQTCESITVALSHSAQGHGKQHYLSAHRPSGTGHTRKWRRLSLPSWLDRCHRPPRAGLHTCLRPLCAGPRHRSHDSNGQRQRTELTLPRPNTRHAHRLAVGSAAAGVRAAEVCVRQNARQAAVRATKGATSTLWNALLTKTLHSPQIPGSPVLASVSKSLRGSWSAHIANRGARTRTHGNVVSSQSELAEPRCGGGGGVPMSPHSHRASDVPPQFSTGE